MNVNSYLWEQLYIRFNYSGDRRNWKFNPLCGLCYAEKLGPVF